MVIYVNNIDEIPLKVPQNVDFYLLRHIRMRKSALKQ